MPPLHKPYGLGDLNEVAERLRRALGFEGELPHFDLKDINLSIDVGDALGPGTGYNRNRRWVIPFNPTAIQPNGSFVRALDDIIVDYVMLFSGVIAGGLLVYYVPAFGLGGSSAGTFVERNIVAQPPPVRQGAAAAVAGATIIANIPNVPTNTRIDFNFNQMCGGLFLASAGDGANGAGLHFVPQVATQTTAGFALGRIP